MFFNNNSEQEQLKKAQAEEKQFVRERDTVNNASVDDATYLETHDRKSDLIRWQQEFNEDLQELYKELLNLDKKGEIKKYKEWDPKIKSFVLREIPPLCNPRFASEIISIAVKPFLSKNNVNSNLTEKTIVRNLRNTHNDIATAICDGWGTNGIKTVNDANKICRLIKNYIDPAAYRAFNGWTKKTDSSMIKRIESQQEMAQTKQEPKGLWGLLSG